MSKARSALRGLRRVAQEVRCDAWAGLARARAAVTICTPGAGQSAIRTARALHTSGRRAESSFRITRAAPMACLDRLGGVSQTFPSAVERHGISQYTPYDRRAYCVLKNCPTFWQRLLQSWDGRLFASDRDDWDSLSRSSFVSSATCTANASMAT